MADYIKLTDIGPNDCYAVLILSYSNSFYKLSDIVSIVESKNGLISQVHVNKIDDSNITQVILYLDNKHVSDIVIEIIESEQISAIGMSPSK